MEIEYEYEFEMCSGSRQAPASSYLGRVEDFISTALFISCPD